VPSASITGDHSMFAPLVRGSIVPPATGTARDAAVDCHSDWSLSMTCLRFGEAYVFTSNSPGVSGVAAPPSEETA